MEAVAYENLFTVKDHHTHDNAPVDGWSANRR